jgi:hypothetical protein
MQLRISSALLGATLGFRSALGEAQTSSGPLNTQNPQTNSRCAAKVGHPSTARGLLT